MEIKILGTGCAGCKSLYETTLKAVEELNIDSNVSNVEDIMQTIGYNFLSLSWLFIAAKVVAAWMNLSFYEIK